MKEKIYTSAEFRAIRGTLGLNQTVFWERVGISQGGGARYELGKRSIPPTVQKLLAIALGDNEEVAAAVKKLRRDYTRATPIVRKDKTIDIRRLRQDLGLNQAPFWEKVCVARPTGSYYETGGSRLFLPVYKLLVIAYGSDEEALAMVKTVRAVGSEQS